MWIFFAFAAGVICVYVATHIVQVAYNFLMSGQASVYEQQDSAFKNRVAVLAPISAISYAAMQFRDGNIIASKKEETVLPIASLTKLMTALVAEKYISPDKKIKVTFAALSTEGETGNLKAGEVIRVGDLFYPLLLESSNDAAEVIARDYGYEAFISLMNKEAKAIGLKKTRFDDPTGLSLGNVSTASDLLRLSKYMYKNYPRIFEITREKQYSIKGHVWENPTHFLNLSSYKGGKNGFTYGALKTSVSIFTTSAGEDVAVVVLRSNDRDRDVLTIMDAIEKAAKVEALVEKKKN